MATQLLKSGVRSNDSNEASSTLDASRQTREKLLGAAQQVFVERGYYDATIRDICQRAGLNIAMVNYHFRDKLGLYTEVLRISSMALKPEPLQHVDDASADPVSLLRDLVSMILRNMRKNEHAFDVLMRQERLRPTPAMEYHIETAMRPAYLATCALIGRIFGLPAEHEKTRLATHSVIAQIKHFGEPERLLSQLDPSILSNQTIESLADTIVEFALASARLARSADRPVSKGSAVSRNRKGPSKKSRR